MKKILSLITAAALMLGTTTAFAQENGAPTGTETVTVTAESVIDDVLTAFDYARKPSTQNGYGTAFANVDGADKVEISDVLSMFDHQRKVSNLWK